MNPTSPTNSERQEVLLGFGYTAREAPFLVTAALHGGYFLRRQFCQFIGKEAGGTANALIEKLLGRKHASVTVGCNNTKLYHLCSRPFYAAIGEEDNRNRRERPPFAIKNRLMGLDFVLAHPENRYLATEREKVECFTATLGIEQRLLPTKRFTSQKTKDTTDRYFVDKYPIFVPLESTSQAVSFCYVDEGMVTGSRFDSYLEQYRSLFCALTQFHVIYAADRDRSFRLAERQFERFLTELNGAATGRTIDPHIRRMLDHFEARSLYEAQQFESFDRAKLIQLRNDREEFRSPKYEALYQRWKTDGEAAIVAPLSAKHRHHRGVNGTFSTHLFAQNYDVFGAAPRASVGPEARGAGRRPHLSKVSGWSSAQRAEET